MGSADAYDTNRAHRKLAKAGLNFDNLIDDGSDIIGKFNDDPQNHEKHPELAQFLIYAQTIIQQANQNTQNEGNFLALASHDSSLSGFQSLRIDSTEFDSPLEFGFRRNSEKELLKFTADQAGSINHGACNAGSELIQLYNSNGTDSEEFNKAAHLLLTKNKKLLEEIELGEYNQFTAQDFSPLLFITEVDKLKATLGYIKSNNTTAMNAVTNSNVFKLSERFNITYVPQIFNIQGDYSFDSGTLVLTKEIRSVQQMK